MSGETNVIVITKNGKTTIITGWRAVLIGTAAFLGTVLMLGLLAFVMLGVAVTLSALALIVLPAAVIVALLASLFSARR
jgi:hypothetical protein